MDKSEKNLKLTIGKSIIVGQGWVIGYMGKTGSASGYHLHFMVKDLKLGKYVDPYTILSLPKKGFIVASDVYYKNGRYNNYKHYNKKTKKYY